LIIELGNASPHRAIDEHPCVTTIHMPDPDAKGVGGYTHKVGGISVADFRAHHHDAILYRGGITHLPDNELLLSVINAWPMHASEKPQWVNVIPQETTDPKVAADVQGFLKEFYELTTDMPLDVEDRYHTRFGPPGHGGPALPPLTALFTNDGRTQQGNNYGGGQVGTTGQATASSAVSLTNSAAAWTTNQWAGYRVYATVSGSAMVWANVISNTATVLTVDRWYTPSTPGGSAGTTPSSTAAYLIADGGVISAWFVGLTTTNIIPSASDHALSGEYTTSGGGLVRKIAPYSLTSGTSPMALTLTPVYTANGTDALPATLYAVGAFVSMVVANTTLAMKFESSLNASQTISASGDQLTITWQENGS
jgi:hypothetical protein